MSIIDRLFSPPRACGSARLAAGATLCFALAALSLEPALDRDAGIPDPAALREARGRVAGVDAQRYGVRFRLHGRPELFNYPSRARGDAIVRAALAAAGSQEVAVLFDPTPHTPWFGSDAYVDVWELAADGRTVRSAAQTKEGWRADNALTPWLCACFSLSGLYLAILTWRARVSRRWT